jgi:hypothetical protein
MKNLIQDAKMGGAKGSAVRISFFEPTDEKVEVRICYLERSDF